MFKYIFSIFMVSSVFVGNLRAEDQISTQDEETMELIRSAVLRDGMIDNFIQSIIQVSLPEGNAEVDSEQLFADIKERIYSSSFLEKYIQEFGQVFSQEEIKELASYYKSTVMDKFCANYQQICMPIIGGVLQEIDSVVTSKLPQTEENDAIISITTENFQQEVTELKGEAILDIYGALCHPCKKLAPIFSALSVEFGSQMKFLKLNADEQGALLQKYAIRSVPTLLFLRDGEVVSRHVGFINKEELAEKIQEFLSQKQS